MFSQLLQQCRQVFKSADQTIKQNKKVLQQSRSVFGTFTQQSNLNIDPTKTFANAPSFSKAQRFKQQVKDEINLNDISICQSEISAQSFQNNKKAFTFTKGQRFLENKLRQKKQSNLTVLYPNYEVIKKNTKQAPIIRPSSRRDLSKSNISQTTAASLSQVGPGKYFIQKVGIDPKRSTAFSKQKRFKKQKTVYQDNPFFINQTKTRKRPPTAAIIKKPIQKNAKLISIEQQQEMRQRIKMIYWKSIPLQLDRLKKTKIGPILRQNYFNIQKMNGRQKRCAILMMLDKLNFIRGGFDNQLRQKIQQKPCGVIYRKSTPKPFKFSQIQPGPDYYYPQDDLIKPSVPQFSFGRVGDKPQKVVYDDRDYQINQKIFEKGGNIIINPIHQEHKLTLDELKQLQRGPGYYDCLFGQVEKRNDIGVVKFVQLDPENKNARQNNCVDVKKDVNDAAYFPKYTAIDPNVGVPLYKQDANVKPIHLPDKVLFPQHWLFYDGDLNKVRAQIAKNVLLAKNMDFKQYQQYTKKFTAFKAYLKLRDNQPQIGQYEPKFTQIDPHVQGFDMKKMVEKTLIQPITKEQGDVDGDNLMLNPQPLKDYLPNFNFGKLIGRQQFENQNSDFDEPRQGDRLILEPKYLQKKLPQIKFEKMQGRNQDTNLDNQDDIAGDVLILNPKPIQKHVRQIDFNKQPQKHQPQILEICQQKEEILIDPKPLPSKIKGFVQMQRMSNVRLVPILRDRSRKKSIQKKQGSLSKKIKDNKPLSISQVNSQNISQNQNYQ